MFLDISNNIKYYVSTLLFSVLVCRENGTVTVGLGSTPRVVRLCFAPHCTVTSTPVCHLNRGNESNLNAIVDTTSQRSFKTLLSFLEP